MNNRDTYRFKEKSVRFVRPRMAKCAPKVIGFWEEGVALYRRKFYYRWLYYFDARCSLRHLPVPVRQSTDYGC